MTALTDAKIKRHCHEVIAALGELGQTQRWLHEKTLQHLRKKGGTLPGAPNFSKLMNGAASLTYDRAIAIADVLEAASDGHFKLENLFPEIAEMTTIGELQSVALSIRTVTLTPPRTAKSVLVQPQGGDARFTLDGSSPLNPARHRLPHGRVVPDLTEKIIAIRPEQKLKIQLAGSVDRPATLVFEWREV
jgi:hypothetical protein